MPPPRESPVYQLIRANHEQAEAGHKRLRTDWREHEERVLSLEQARNQYDVRLANLDAALTALKTAPQDLSKITLSPGLVAAIVLSIGGIIAGQVGSTWGMRSDIRDINTHLSTQAETDKNKQALQDDRYTALKGAVDDIKKKQDLQQLEIQNLRETILQGRSR
jgi:hypothetical protein